MAKAKETPEAAEAGKGKAKKPPEAGEADDPKPKKKGKQLLVLLLALLLLGGGGGGAWYLLNQKSKAPVADAKKKDEKPKPPVFVALDTFTVNLQSDPADQYLQTAISLKVADSGIDEAIKLHMPEIRNRILLLLSSKKGSELAGIEGKQLLANQIASEVNQVLNAAAGKALSPAAPGPVLSVFFTQFIIQ